MNTYFFVTNVPEKTTLPQYFTGIAVNVWPIGLGVIILFLMAIMHQLNFIRIAEQDRAYTGNTDNTASTNRAAAAIPFAKPKTHTPAAKQKEAPVYFAINTPPPPVQPQVAIPAPPQTAQAVSDAPASMDTPPEQIPTSPEPEQQPAPPKNPSLSFFKLD